MRNTILCDCCGNSFYKSKAHAARAKHNYCSPECWRSRDLHPSQDIFSIIDTQEKAYWLGMVCADGWLDARDKAVCLELKSTDKEHVKHFADWSGATFSKRGRACLYSKTAFADLVAKGVTPAKSKYLDATVFQHVPHRLTNHFIRGWFDGDGSIGKHKSGKWQLTFVGTYESMQQIRCLVVENVQVPSLSISPCRSIFDIRWGTKASVEKIADWMYNEATIGLQRKWNTYWMLKHENSCN